MATDNPAKNKVINQEARNLEKQLEPIITFLQDPNKFYRQKTLQDSRRWKWILRLIPAKYCLPISKISIRLKLSGLTKLLFLKVYVRGETDRVKLKSLILLVAYYSHFCEMPRRGRCLIKKVELHFCNRDAKVEESDYQHILFTTCTNSHYHFDWPVAKSDCLKSLKNLMQILRGKKARDSCEDSIENIMKAERDKEKSIMPYLKPLQPSYDPLCIYCALTVHCQREENISSILPKNIKVDNLRPQELKRSLRKFPQLISRYFRGYSYSMLLVTVRKAIHLWKDIQFDKQEIELLSKLGECQLGFGKYTWNIERQGQALGLLMVHAKNWDSNKNIEIIKERMFLAFMGKDRYGEFNSDMPHENIKFLSLNFRSFLNEIKPSEIITLCESNTILLEKFVSEKHIVKLFDSYSQVAGFLMSIQFLEKTGLNFKENLSLKAERYLTKALNLISAYPNYFSNVQRIDILISKGKLFHWLYVREGDAKWLIKGIKVMEQAKSCIDPNCDIVNLKNWECYFLLGLLRRELVLLYLDKKLQSLVESSKKYHKLESSILEILYEAKENFLSCLKLCKHDSPEFIPTLIYLLEILLDIAKHKNDIGPVLDWLAILSPARKQVMDGTEGVLKVNIYLAMTEILFSIKWPERGSPEQEPKLIEIIRLMEIFLKLPPAKIEKTNKNILNAAQTGALKKLIKTIDDSWETEFPFQFYLSPRDLTVASQNAFHFALKLQNPDLMLQAIEVGRYPLQTWPTKANTLKELVGALSDPDEIHRERVDSLIEHINLFLFYSVQTEANILDLPLTISRLYKETISHLKTSFPKSFFTTIFPQNIDNITSELKCPQQRVKLFVRFDKFEKHYFIFIVGSGGSTYVQFDKNQSKIISQKLISYHDSCQKNAVNEYLEECFAWNIQPSKEEIQSRLKYISLARAELEKCFWSPILDQMEEVIDSEPKEFEIYPDHLTWNMPFAGFSIKSGEYMGQAKHILYYPSISLKKMAQNLKRVRLQNQVKKKKEKSGQVSVVLGKTYFKNEQEALGEAKEILNLNENQELNITTLNIATKKRFIDSLDSEFLHVIAHCGYDTENPLASYIELADGKLSPLEIAKLQNTQKPLLISFSSCWSGQTGGIDEIDFSPMFRSVIAQGIPSMLGQTREVYQGVTKQIMPSFYKEVLRNDCSLSLALQKARMSLKGTMWEDPYFWEQFILFSPD